jgi:hypothetical protein
LQNVCERPLSDFTEDFFGVAARARHCCVGKPVPQGWVMDQELHLVRQILNIAALEGESCLSVTD